MLFNVSCTITYLGNIPEVPAIKKQKISAEQKREATFSISATFPYIGSEYGSFSINKDLQETAGKYLEKTGLFSRVTYVPFNERSNYHFHFELVESGVSRKYQEASLKTVFRSIPLIGPLIIPFTKYHYVDINVYLFADDKEAFSSTIAERMKETSSVLTLVLFPISMAISMGNSPSIIIDKSIRYFTHQISAGKLNEINAGSDFHLNYPKYLEDHPEILERRQRLASAELYADKYVKTMDDFWKQVDENDGSKKKVIIPPLAILFEQGKVSIPKKSINAIHDFIDSYKLTDVNNPVSIDCYIYADNKDENDKMSLQRSKSLAEYFEKDGISAERLEIYSNGRLERVNFAKNCNEKECKSRCIIGTKASVSDFSKETIEETATESKNEKE